MNRNASGQNLLSTTNTTAIVTSTTTSKQQQQQQQQQQPLGSPRFKGQIRKQNAICVTLSPDLHENLVRLCESSSNAMSQSKRSSINTATSISSNNNNNNNNNNSNNNYNVISIENKSDQQRKASSARTSASSSTLLLNLESQRQLLMPRKSIIGTRLERSSFQTQRLSDVGVAFGQQLTAKMGLKLPASQERIVEQTRKLYLKYLFKKLRQNSLPLRDLNLTKSSKNRRALTILNGKRDIQTGSDNLLPKIVCSAPNSALPYQDSTQRPFVLPIITTTATATATATNAPETANHQLHNTRRRATLLVGQNFVDTNIASLQATSDIIREHKMSTGSEHQTISPSSSAAASNSNSNHLNNGNENFSLAGPSSSKRFIMDSTLNNQIFLIIMRIINEFRELKPDYYGDTIYEHVGIDKFSSLDSLLNVQLTICQEMTRSEISWFRICALFSLIASMSLDCVRLGLPEHVGPLLDGFIEFVEKDLALWISQQGGWESFLYKNQASYSFSNAKSITILSMMVPISLWALIKLFW